MNRFTQKVLSGGIAAGLSLAIAASVSAQARSGAWTLNGKEAKPECRTGLYVLTPGKPLRCLRYCS